MNAEEQLEDNSFQVKCNPFIRRKTANNMAAT